MQPPLSIAVIAVRRSFGSSVPPCDIDDMIQDASVKVWQTAGRIDSDRDSAGWYLYRTALSAAYDHLRRRMRDREVLVEYSCKPQDYVPTPEEELIAEETRQQIVRVFRRAYRCMSDNERARFRVALRGGDWKASNRNTDKTFAWRVKQKLAQAAEAEGCPDLFDSSRLRALLRR